MADEDAKSPRAFRTISEVSDEVGVPQHVLRFWEAKFPAIKPLKRGGNRRYYRPEDVELLRVINRLLYTDGYTIRGVQKLLNERGANLAALAQTAPEARPDEADRSLRPVDLFAPEGNDAPATEVSRESAAMPVDFLTELQAIRDLLADGLSQDRPRAAR